MYLSGKVTNSFLVFLDQCEFDTSNLFEITQLEPEFLRNPHSWLEASSVEHLLTSIQEVYRQQFIDKDIITTVGHNSASLQAWGGLDDFIKASFDTPKDVHQKLETIFSYFVSPCFEMSNVQETEDSFYFETNFDFEEYPSCTHYFKSVLESIPVFTGQDLTEVTWNENSVEIFYPVEESLELPFLIPEKKNSTIFSLHGREIIDSRGCPTLEVEVELNSGDRAQACIPSGASTGKHEAKELRDGNKKYFFGKGVTQACENIYKINQHLKNHDIFDQKGLDSKLIQLDGTASKEKLGANALLGVSLSCLRAAAITQNLPLYKYLNPLGCQLPVPLINVINGGAHAKNSLNLQEFMLVPYDFTSFKQALRAGCEIFHTLKQILHAKNLSTNVGDEGGFSPDIRFEAEALELILTAVDKCGYSGRVGLALDSAASEFYSKDGYFFEGKNRSSKEMVSIYSKWIDTYPLISIEDGLDQEDWQGWERITEELGSKVQLVGDDIFVTQKQLVKTGIERHVANSLLVKCNQVGTITETEEAIRLAQKHGYTCVMSHRSGETEDTSIADLCVGWSCEQIKTGSVSRGERTAKYNRLLKIEEELGAQAVFRGKHAFKGLK